jgi:hypothetical protein
MGTTQLTNFTLLCISQQQVPLHLQLLQLAYFDQLISSANHLKGKTEGRDDQVSSTEVS